MSRGRTLAFDAVVLLLVAAAVAAGFAMIAATGYGDNTDNYASLRAWQVMAGDGRYVASRFQGNLPSELAVGWLAHRFGPWGPNALSLACGLASLALLFALLRRLGNDTGLALLAVASVAANPYWQRAASTSMDYLHPMPFLLGGLVLLTHGRAVLPALLFALAGAIRLSHAPLALLLLVGGMLAQKRRGGDIAEAVLVLEMVTGLFYLPVWISSKLTLDFLTSGRPLEQGFAGLAARFVVKGAYLYGLAGTFVVLAALATRARTIASLAATPWRDRRAVAVAAALLVIAWTLALFLYIPVRAEYLIPVLPAVAVLFVAGGVDRRWIAAVIVLELVGWLVVVDVIDARHRFTDPCAPVQATGARIAPHIAPGPLWEPLNGRTNEVRCLAPMLRDRYRDVGDRLPLSGN